MSKDLSPAEIVALGKVVSGARVSAASKELGAGDYDVDFLVQVTGSIRRGEDYSQEIVLKAEPWTILAAALSHLNGVTVESLVKEALISDPELVKSIKKKATDAMKRINKTTVTACNGKVTTQDLTASGLN